MSAAQGPSVSWDVFHADSLELERGLSTAAVRAALAGGALRDDDLVRPAGTTAAWSRLADIPELAVPETDRPDQPPTGLEFDLGPSGRRAGTAAGGPSGSHRAGRVAAAARRGQRLRARGRRCRRTDPSTAPAPTTPPPAWLQLGGEPDDVTFPVMPGPTGRQRPPEPSRPEPESTAAPAWTWAEVEDEDDEADEPDDDDFDEQIEILDDDGRPGWRSSTRMG